MILKTIRNTLLAVVLGSATSLHAETKPNFVIIFTDDQGYGDLNPLSPPSAPVQRWLQGPPAKSKFLAATGQSILLILTKFSEYAA